MIGLGGRLRVTPSVYVVGEVTPRIRGYKPGGNLGSFAVEKRVGRHVSQLNFSNYFGATTRQIAQGAVKSHEWHLGFNIPRKFF